MIKIMTQKQYDKELDKATAFGVRIGSELGKIQARNQMWAEFHLIRNHPPIPRSFIEAFQNDSLDDFETGCR